ncbi:cystathionine gamma-synthase [Paeniglutamicibacter antarcticus]|uniref:Cystathionine gamma-synthase n=1 Tax=Paeniglutamicibacter antarcticus TaxID=494023 RepID=A0ABP9TM73_9MICC
MTENTQGFNTRAVHAGQGFEPRTGAVVPPLHFSSTYAQDGIGNLRAGYEYGRGGNPTRDALQEQLAAVENGTHAYSFSSGLAAEDSVIRALAEPGDHIVLGNDAYGGTYRLISRVLGGWGIGNTPVDMGDHAALKDAVEANQTKLVWVESPSNPMMRISDIRAIAKITHEAGALLVVDNTFASPALQQPLDLGADVVIHSTTKYIGGHSDVVGGAVVLNDPVLAEAIGFIQFAVGAVSGPMDAFLTTRGLKTLGVRMRTHSENAMAVARWLQGRPEVEAVHYPGLESHPQHELAKSQMSDFGGMVSVQFSGGEDAARTVAESTRVFTLAESLGAIESLMNYPSEMTHASVKGTELAVPVNLLRTATS